MNLTKPIVLAASLAVLAGCEHNVQDTSALEAGIAEVKSGDFGTCYQNIHAAALALERAEKGLAHIQKVDNVHTEGTYPAAMQAVEDARAARAAADEACHVRVAALEAEMPGIKAQLADHEKRIAWLEKLHSLMSGVTFRTDSAQLTAPAQTALDMVANVLLRWPHDVEIRGYASSPGDEAYNIGLSDRRAKAVRAYLVNRGVSGSRISTSAYGESDAVASNDTAEGRRANQRAVVLHAGM